jgi:DNA-binding NarL/FixJ family response regulator
MTQASPVLTQDLPQPIRQAQPAREPSDGRAKIAVLVVAGERLFGLGVARLLGEDENLDVIGVWDGDADLPALCASASINVVLVDLELSRIDGIELVRRLAVECPSTKSLVLTSNPDWRVRTAMIAGAAGVLLKDTSPEATRAAVVSVHLGDQVLCSEAARWVLGDHGSVRLTKRESDVLRVLSQGADNAEIARQLQLGQKTVRNYISRLYRKLDVDSRAQLARYLARADAGVQGSAD